MPANHFGKLPGYGQFWYGPKDISNILGMSNVADNDKYWDRYDSQDIKDFVDTHTKDGKETRFCWATCGLHRIDTKATETSEDKEILINTIEDNKRSYTHFSYLRAKLARKLKRNIGQPSIKTLEWIIGSNLLTNCPVNIANVSAE